jgi:hypothetical protein
MQRHQKFLIVAILVISFIISGLGGLYLVNRSAGEDSGVSEETEMATDGEGAQDGQEIQTDEDASSTNNPVGEGQDDETQEQNQVADQEAANAQTYDFQSDYLAFDLPDNLIFRSVDEEAGSADITTELTGCYNIELETLSYPTGNSDLESVVLEEYAASDLDQIFSPDYNGEIELSDKFPNYVIGAFGIGEEFTVFSGVSDNDYVKIYVTKLVPAGGGSEVEEKYESCQQQNYLPGIVDFIDSIKLV